MISVEIVYVRQDQSLLQLVLDLDAGARVQEALEASKLWRTHPETKDLHFGIFAKPASLDTRLKDGDRIEIYRPLLIDPKEKRRQRAKKAKL